MRALRLSSLPSESDNREREGVFTEDMSEETELVVQYAKFNWLVCQGLNVSVNVFF